MKRVKSRGQIITLFAAAAFVALAFSGQTEISGATIVQLGQAARGHALFIGSDGTMTKIDLSAATAEGIVLPLFAGLPDRAFRCAVDPLSEKVLIAIDSQVGGGSRMSLFSFGDLKKPLHELQLDLNAVQVEWNGRKGEFYVDAEWLGVRPRPGARLLLHDSDGGLISKQAPKLSIPIRSIALQNVIFNGIPPGTRAFGATLQPAVEKTAEFESVSIGLSPYYHVYLCLTRDGQLTKAWPAGSVQAVAFSFDGQTILARYQPPTEEIVPPEMAKFDVKSGQIQKCDWLPPDTIHLFCASDDLNEVIIPVARAQRGASVEFTKVRDALFADLPQNFNVCIARVSAKRPPLMIHTWSGGLDKAFDFAAMTTAPGEYWITDGMSLWHLNNEGLVTKRELKIK